MKKILVVDDEPGVREFFADALAVLGYAVQSASDGLEALEHTRRERFDLILLDVWMPRMTGLEVLAELRRGSDPPRVIVTTADGTPETLLRAIREQAYRYLTKPCPTATLVEAVRGALDAPASPPAIEVLSARPNWVELLVPCELHTAERIQEFLEHLKADLPAEVRQRVGHAFRELLLNAIEWGGHLDPNRKVRIAYLRAERMLLYRIADPGEGFRFEGLVHAAVGHSPEAGLAHVGVREERGLRPGGFGILMARAMADELIYNEAQNEVVLIQYLEARPSSSPRTPGTA